jgi:hypothetical protein
MDIEVGTEVEVTYRNPQYERRHVYAHSVHIPEFVTYTGAVYPRQKWQSPTTLNLTTGIKDWTWRELQDGNIVKVTAKGRDIKIGAPIKTQDRVWEVAGSRGNVYTVTEVSGKRTCTCPGFQFRHSCKHTTEVG